MRNALWMSVLAAGAVCVSLPSVSAAQAKPAAPGPCSDGTCKITIELPSEIAPDLNIAQLNYKAYKGCPRDLGYVVVMNKDDGGSAGFDRKGSSIAEKDYNKSAATMRAAVPIAESHNPIIQLPAFDGKIATVMFWMGANPDQIAVVDFSSKKAVVIPAPYMQKSDAGSAGKFDKGKGGGGAAGSNVNSASGKASAAFDDDDVLDKRNDQAITKCKA